MVRWRQVLQYLQFIVGLSPLESALALLPLPAVLIPLARRAPAIADRFGINRVGSAGLALLAAGLVVISFVGVDLDYPLFALGVMTFAAGAALAGTPATTAIVSALPPSKQGVASAVNDVSREFGSALGIALLGSVLNETYRSALDGAPEALRESIAVVASGAVPPQLVAAAQEAYVDATAAAVLVGAAVALCAALFVFVTAPRRDARQVEASTAARSAVAGRTNV